MKNQNSKIFFISDIHFFHTNIIKYCNRPYDNVDEMNADIIRRWNAVVNKNDIVWNLGDFIFAKKGNIETVREYVKKLNGRQYLVLGNHDRHVCKDMTYWYDCGFERVYDKPVLFQERYILSHEPVFTRQHLDLSGTDLVNIHGHIHNSNQDFYNLKDEDKQHWNSKDHQELRTIPDISKNSFNVSIEVINYTPIRWEQIVDSINKSPSITFLDPTKEFHIPFDQTQITPHIIPSIQIPSSSNPLDNVPDACKHCSNRNPDGTYRGPCMCTLNTPKITC